MSHEGYRDKHTPSYHLIDITDILDYDSKKLNSIDKDIDLINKLQDELKQQLNEQDLKHNTNTNEAERTNDNDPLNDISQDIDNEIGVVSTDTPLIHGGISSIVTFVVTIILGLLIFTLIRRLKARKSNKRKHSINIKIATPTARQDEKSHQQKTTIENSNEIEVEVGNIVPNPTKQNELTSNFTNTYK